MIVVERLLSAIRSWFTVPIENTRKRRAIDDIEFDNITSSKIRRKNSLEKTFLDENIFAFPSILNKPAIMEPYNTYTRQKKKVIDTINLDDDDDDVVEVPISKKNYSKALNHSKNKYTSTPTDAEKYNKNIDDDVIFVKDFKSPISFNKSRSSKLNGTDSLSDILQDSHNGRTHSSNPSSNMFSISADSKNRSKQQFKDTPIPLRRRANRKSVLDHSYRLDDKLRYQKLLESTSSNFSGLSNSSVYYTPLSKFIDLCPSSRAHKILSMVDKSPKEKTGDFVKKVLKDIEKEPIEIQDSDSDVEILPTPPSPKPDIKVDPVNTLKPLVDFLQPTKEKWLEDLIRNHREVLQLRQNDIETYDEQLKTLHDINTSIRIGTLAKRVDRSLSIRDYVLPVEEKEEEIALPELTEEYLQMVKRAFSGNPNEVLVKKFSLSITRRDILTLQNLNWLNDEVINFYMNMIMERGKSGKFPKVYAMNTFFYPKLLKDGPESLRRWTRKVDIFAYDLICIPIHLGVHWCMAIIDFRDQSIRYYDSMGGCNRECTRSLRAYLEYEHMDKKKQPINTDDFILEDVKDIPQQMNGSDCGMFSCMFAEYLSRNAKITFTQEDMPYFRKKMVVEILQGELLIQ